MHGGRELGDPEWSVRGGVEDWWKNDDDIDMRKKIKKSKDARARAEGLPN